MLILSLILMLILSLILSLILILILVQTGCSCRLDAPEVEQQAHAEEQTRAEVRVQEYVRVARRGRAHDVSLSGLVGDGGR